MKNPMQIVLGNGSTKMVEGPETLRVTVQEFVSLQHCPSSGFEVTVSGYVHDPRALQIRIRPMLGTHQSDYTEEWFTNLIAAAELAMARGRALRERVMMCLEREVIS